MAAAIVLTIVALFSCYLNYQAGIEAANLSNQRAVSVDRNFNLLDHESGELKANLTALGDTLLSANAQLRILDRKMKALTKNEIASENTIAASDRAVQTEIGNSKSRLNALNVDLGALDKKYGELASEASQTSLLLSTQGKAISEIKSKTDCIQTWGSFTPMDCGPPY
ncbi:MAG: hypothetical protein KGQ79_05885 [Proteobacteria bacterium]|nr:hypothetical protein [Pseudomonadota bacterium]